MSNTARHASLAELADILKDQHSRKLDVVAPATSLRVRSGVLTVRGSEPQLTADGVTTADGSYRPTEVFDEGLARTFNIPTGYLKRLRAQATDLYDANINGWLHGRKVIRAAGPETIREADARSFLVRCFRGGDGDEGIARAILSDRYQVVDNLDVLTAALDGIRESGIEAVPVTCDLTDRRMHVRVAAPGVQAQADTLLANYRNPFDDPAVERERGAGGQRWENIGVDDNGDPHVFAGFDIRNSETGDGAFTIVPVVTISTCRNGLTLTREAYRKVHLGRKLEVGSIDWSADTQHKNLELVRAQTRDAVASFLSEEWLRRVAAELDAKAGARIEKTEVAIRTVGKTLQYSEGEINGVLDHFIRGGQLTAGGVANAVTSYAQTVDNADRSHELEDSAVRAMELAAR